MKVKTFKIPDYLLERLKEYASERYMSEGEVIRRALHDYLFIYDKCKLACETKRLILYCKA